MIAKLTGTAVERFGGELFLETNSGVTYRVFIGESMQNHFISLPKSDVSLYTYLNVKEDSLTLFGFNTHAEYRIFTMLLSVDGVGPKSAYLIVGTYSASSIRNAIADNDVYFFQQVKGIGKKTAQRIIVDLAEKIGSEADISSMNTPEHSDVVDALVSLGFRRKDAQKAIHEVSDKGSTFDELLKMSLQVLANKK